MAQAGMARHLGIAHHRKALQPFDAAQAFTRE
jgi:hypothetical protein